MLFFRRILHFHANQSNIPALTTMKRESPRFCTIVSSLIPPFSLVNIDSLVAFFGRAATLAETSFSMKATRSLPVTLYDDGNIIYI